METVAVKASSREMTGSKGARATRNDGLIPAVVYGGEDVNPIAVEFNAVRDAIYTADFKVVELELDGKPVRCIIRDVQFHPVTEDIVHIDFQELVPGRKIKVEVPVRFTGTAPGLKAGGKLIQKLRRISVMTTAEKLLTEVVLDVSQLQVGQSVRVKECRVPEGVLILNDGNMPVASVQIPRALKTATEVAEGEEGDEDEEGEEGGDAGEAEGGDAPATEEASE
ncbi:MAG: 50S ribosomal protein L25 [Saprospiraceae bacterium]|nr:50S ribosomal protein L25 [Saprospiraceae bacterium]